MSLYGANRRILLDEVADKLAERGPLRGSPGVLGRLAVGSAAADVGNPDGACVVASDVSADLIQRSTGRDSAVEVQR